MAEGGRLVRQGLDGGWQPNCIAVTAEGLSRSHIADLAVRARAAGGRIIEVPERLLSQITSKDNPGGIAAAFEQRHCRLDDMENAETEIWIALYEIRDPGNLGTIMRTADCVGASGLILLGTCCDPYSQEAVRASMGAVFDIPFIATEFDAFDQWRQRKSAMLVAASINGTQHHDKIDYGRRITILMGNEQAGLPQRIEAACDDLALIPMRASADSLNLAQATALMTYEAWRAQGYHGASVPGS